MSLSGTPIIGGLKEDPEGDNDAYLWDVTGVPDGTYFIYATITDGTTTRTSYGPAAITFDKTPPEVVATPPGGIYSSPQSVTLTPNEPADIYYTIDGSDPTPISTPYTLPIEITQTTTLKFMSVDSGGNQSSVFTEVYEIQEGFELLYLTATGQIMAARLKWATDAEPNIAGYHVWRSESADGEYTRITQSLIPATGGTSTGGTYEYVDNTAVAGPTYYYKIEAVRISGPNLFFGPVSAIPTAAWRAPPPPAEASTIIGSAEYSSFALNNLGMLIFPMTLLFVWKRVRRSQKQRNI